MLAELKPLPVECILGFMAGYVCDYHRRRNRGPLVGHGVASARSRSVYVFRVSRLETALICSPADDDRGGKVAIARVVVVVERSVDYKQGWGISLSVCIEEVFWEPLGCPWNHRSCRKLGRGPFCEIGM